MDAERAEREVTDLFNSCYAGTVRYAAHRCGSVDLAEEFVQEAFGSLYSSLREGASIREPRAWIMKAVSNQICKSWRRASARSEQSVSRLELETVPYVPDSHERSGDQGPRRLEAFLEELTPREKDVVLLRAQGLRYREIGAELGISSNSVGTLLLRAMRKMRKVRAEEILGSVGEAAGSK